MVNFNYKKKSSFRRKSFCTHIMRNRKSGDLIEFYLNLWCNFKGCHGCLVQTLQGSSLSGVMKTF